jgi:hypothetical protein
MMREEERESGRASERDGDVCRGRGRDKWERGGGGRVRTRMEERRRAGWLEEWGRAGVEQQRCTWVERRPGHSNETGCGTRQTIHIQIPYLSPSLARKCPFRCSVPYDYKQKSGEAGEKEGGRE